MMIKKRESFSKAERLCNVRTISTLFSKGRTIQAPPLKVIFLFSASEKQGNSGAEILISVPKRLFRKAVDRNLLKRRMREAYRRNRAALPDILTEKKLCLSIAFLWNDHGIRDYRSVEESVRAAVIRLSDLARSINFEQNFSE